MKACKQQKAGVDKALQSQQFAASDDEAKSTRVFAAFLDSGGVLLAEPHWHFPSSRRTLQNEQKGGEGI